MRRLMLVVPVLAGAVLSGIGCLATKEHVRVEVGKTGQQIEEVKHRVERLETEFDQEARIVALEFQVVETRAAADGAAQRADQASKAAGRALSKAEEASHQAAQAVATTKPVGRAAVRNGANAAETITVLFGFAQSQLDARAQAALAKAAKQAHSDPKLLVQLEGHSDNVGSTIENLQISQLRAEAVRRFLLNHGIEVARIRILAYGDSKPAADNRTKVGRVLNRRVTIRFVLPSS